MPGFSEVKLLILSLFWPSFSGDCREMGFPESYFFARKRLIKHIISTVQVGNMDTCELRCYQEHDCVSFNLGINASPEGTFSCELNNATHLEQDGDFEDAKDFVYRGGEVKRTFLISTCFLTFRVSIGGVRMSTRGVLFLGALRCARIPAICAYAPSSIPEPGGISGLSF